MPFIHKEWTTCTCVDAKYIRSQNKNTPGLEMALKDSAGHEIRGVWWMTDTVGKSGNPGWKDVMDRLISLGATDAELRDPTGWIETMCKTVMGKPFSVLPAEDKYGFKADAITIPRSGPGPGFKPVEEPSLFAAKMSGADEETPF